MDLYAIPEVLWSIVMCFVHGALNWMKYLFPTSFFKSIDGDIIVITGKNYLSKYEKIRYHELFQVLAPGLEG